MTWNTTTMATIAMTTGRTPLSPARIRATYARTYSPSDCATTSGGSSATAASGAAAVRSGATLSVISALFSGSATGAAQASCRHVLDNALPVEIRGLVLHRHAAEVEVRDVVRDLEDVVQVVRDDHHGQALVAQPPDEVEHHPGLDDAERGRRLVHEHEFRVPHHRLGDGDRLALPPGQRRHRLADGSHGGDAQARQRFRSGALHAVLIEQSVAQPLASQEHVLDDVEIVGQREVLVDRLDTEARGVARGVDVDGMALPGDLAVVYLVDARDALGEHRLAGAVVPAQGGHLAGRDVQVDVVQRLDRTEMLVQLPNLQQRLASCDRRRHMSRIISANKEKRRRELRRRP